ncbi:uncharacterized protein LOC116300401 [Actinia tenebrosa]|uniref:Uncharacterized protein LOC116300401 n=1 Tax=Actinia tenebrosa TaxID=6105 RepID=A0A6P8I997_ACTTE|nr:uncharacterized protein LOC116300401 [Actinia tenebrosa]
MDNREDLPPFLRIASRPKHAISDRNGEKIELQAPAPSTLLYVQDCKNCEFELEKKALKVIVDGCKDCLFNVNNSLLTGMIEVLNCENLALNILENGVIMTLTIDGSKNIKVNALKNDQFESIYTHHSLGVEVVVGTENPTRVPVVIDDEPERQYLVHWEKDGDNLNLTFDKVIRDGNYPTTEKKLAEARERERKMSKKMATMLVDSIKVTKKSKKSKSKEDGEIKRSRSC